VGVRLSQLVHGSYQINIFEDTEEDIKLHQAMDRIKFKFGCGKLIRASTLGINPRVRQENNFFMG